MSRKFQRTYSDVDEMSLAATGASKMMRLSSQRDRHQANGSLYAKPPKLSLDELSAAGMWILDPVADITHLPARRIVSGTRLALTKTGWKFLRVLRRLIEVHSDGAYLIDSTEPLFGV